MPFSPVDSISPAFEHTKDQLFRHFRLGQWLRLAFVGLLAGELSSAGGGNINIPSTNLPHHHRNFLPTPHFDPALLIPLIVIAVIAVPLLWLLFLYISSRMRFVLFDSVVEKNCEIGRMWRARRAPGLHYFVWQIVFSLITFGGFILILGVPALIAFLLGWFNNWHDHLPGLIVFGLLAFMVLLVWGLLSLLVHVFTKDFVVPQMALENVSAFDGWARLIAMISGEKGRYAGYAGMKLVLAIGAAVAVGIATLVLLLILLLPVGGLGVVAVLVGKAAGLSWNVFTITLAVVSGCIVLALIIYGVALISVPVIVFFPAYAIHFFAARYPLLAKLIYPPPPPPSMSPAPEPIG